MITTAELATFSDSSIPFDSAKRLKKVKGAKGDGAFLALPSFDGVGAVSLMVFLAGLVLSLSFGYTYVPFGSVANSGAISLTRQRALF